ncbi:YdjC-like protein [Paenibacillus sp. 1_12]|uniref:ChbG/HpnK family deacetylase n=1 Tax=Paenibacillus sp. 1_12 TaxID=1566278 RepID=UPI0008F1336F|nr:ChbG/HpnK family deacetylase [Paenibacillus sp. 1_12]SFL94356.1 YdjC-like protein [Paenibacillus sp. 1_12]
MIEKWGNALEDRLLIINADDFGLTKGTNDAIIHLFEQGAITSASIMMPCSAAREAAMYSVRKGYSHIRIHLTLTSQNTNPLKPVFQESAMKSLTTQEGCFHHEASYLEQNADPEEVSIELDAQIQKAISLGIDPTHLDSHAGSIMGISGGRDFLELTLICAKNIGSRLTCH